MNAAQKELTNRSRTKPAMNAQKELSIAIKLAGTQSAEQILILLSSSAKYGWHFSWPSLNHGLDLAILDETGRQIPRNAAGDELADPGSIEPFKGPRSVDISKPVTNPLNLGDYFNLLPGHEYRVSVVWKLRVFGSHEELLKFARGTGQRIELKAGPFVIRIPEK